MKNHILINTITLLFLIGSCKEKEVPTSKPITPTIFKGKCTIVNTNIPAPNVDVFIYTGGFPYPDELIDETVTDSNGNYILEFKGDHLNAKMRLNFHPTGIWLAINGLFPLLADHKK